MGTLFWMGVLFTLMILVLVTLVRYEDSQKFRYRFKFCFYVFFVSFINLLSIPFFAIRPKNVENLLMVIPSVKFASKLLGVKWEIRGAEILATDVPCVIVCNHQTILDTLGMAHMWPLMKRCATVAKKELLYVFPFGLSAWLCGTVFIDRSKGSKSIVKLSTTAETIQKENTKLWIFPEGTRHKGAELLPFKKGAFHIAMQCKLPIVPVVISPYTFIDDEKEIFDQGRVVMSILPQISTTEITDVDELLEKTRDLMNKEFRRLTAELQPSGTNDRKEVNGSGGTGIPDPVTTLGDAKKLL